MDIPFANLLGKGCKPSLNILGAGVGNASWIRNHRERQGKCYASRAKRENT
jgi:hypothetical protein